jgi:hypothetical protein
MEKHFLKCVILNPEKAKGVATSNTGVVASFQFVAAGASKQDHDSDSDTVKSIQEQATTKVDKYGTTKAGKVCGQCKAQGKRCHAHKIMK